MCHQDPQGCRSGRDVAVQSAETPSAFGESEKGNLERLAEGITIPVVLSAAKQRGPLRADKAKRHRMHHRMIILLCCPADITECLGLGMGDLPCRQLHNRQRGLSPERFGPTTSAVSQEVILCIEGFPATLLHGRPVGTTNQHNSGVKRHRAT